MKKYRNGKRKNGLLRIIIISLLVLLSSVALHPVQTRADFGDFAGDTDYGGGDDYSDWGGGDDSDYDSESSGKTDLIEAIFGEDVAMVIYCVIIFGVWGFLIYAIVSDIRTKRQRKKGIMPGAEETAQYMLTPMEEYRELDPAFDEAELKERLSNLYIQMQQCWHEKNIESLKPYFTDAFYNQSDMQLEQKRRSRQTPCTERVAVLEVTPRGFYQSNDGLGSNNGMDHIVVRIRARIVAYTLDDNTGKVISGDRNKEKFMTYEWDLCRRSDVTTPVKGEMRSISCPHCGAPLNINQTAKCPYCDSVVTVINEDWALNSIKGIAQRTV